nr:protein FAR1-related sequence 5-like [Tanacetum cinerariifolium]
DEPIHQNPMGIPESGSMARQTTLGYASSFDDDMVKTIPKGSKFWISEAKNKPMLGTTFDSVEEAFQFYKAYAIKVGFEVKRDETAKRNYAAFGDVFSFYATFCSNRYNMVLVPFTGIDNHNRCVSFDAALLASESSKKYTWLLTIFKKVFGNAPKIYDVWIHGRVNTANHLAWNNSTKIMFINTAEDDKARGLLMLVVF